MEKGTGVFAEGPPGILTIQDHGQHPVFIPCDLSGKTLLDLTHEIPRCLLIVGIAIVVKTNVVGELCVSKEDAQGMVSLFGAIGSAQNVRIVHTVPPAP